LKYAAYGSNLHPLRLRKRTDEARLLGTARVDGFALRFHKRGNLDGSGKCNIVEQTDSHVLMAIFEIPDRGIDSLDIEEGVGSGYERRSIEAGEFGHCLTYLAQDSHIDEELLPFTWYKELVLAGCRVHGFPDDYVAAIRAVNAVNDPDPERHRFHIQLLDELEVSLFGSQA